MNEEPTEQLTPHRLTECEALAVTQAIRDSVENIGALLKQAYEGEAWLALQYENWREYAEAEFSVSQRRAYQLLDEAQIRSLCTNVQNLSEGTIRPLASLKKDPEAMNKAVTIANERTDGKPTAKDVQAAVEEVKAEAIEADEIEPPKKERTPAYQPSNGLQYAEMAISQMQKIQPNDTQRTRAFERMAKWLAENK